MMIYQWLVYGAQIVFNKMCIKYTYESYKKSEGVFI